MAALRKALGAALIAMALAGPARGEEPAGADAARAVIQSQLDAFRREAVEDAYQYAAPNIQRIFPTPEVFGRMVRNGYPMVWDPAQTEFLSAEPRGDLIIQRLRFVDQAGRPFIAEYAMALVEGTWRIAGVEIKEDTSFGA